MQTNPRTLRAEADAFDRQLRFPPERDRQQREHILTVAQALLARHGRHTISFTTLAAALRMAPATLRRHFIDLDALLGDILGRHLLALAAALGEIPFDHPDRARQKRAAYFTYTRGAFGGLTEAHLLYTRDRHLLPDDILTSLELTRDGLGDLLAGPNAREALLLLDTPYIPLTNIEAMLAALPQEPITETTAETTAEPATEPATAKPKPSPAPTPKQTHLRPSSTRHQPPPLRPPRPWRPTTPRPARAPPP
jgi:AcrR family transcriptional regulator